MINRMFGGILGRNNIGHNQKNKKSTMHLKKIMAVSVGDGRNLRLKIT